MLASLKPLNQQVIVITGASSGIGLATTRLAAERAAKLVLIARSAEMLKGLAAQIRGSGGEAIHIVADVADRNKIDAGAREAINCFGRIDTWINNAGVSIYGNLEEVSEADSRRLFDTIWGS